MCKRPLFIFSWALVALLAVAAFAGENSKSVSTPAWGAISNFLSWEKFWYGEFYGGACYNRLIGKRVRVGFKQDTIVGTPRIFQCDRTNRKEVRVNSFTAYIPGTNILFEGSWLSTKPVSQIVMGSSVGCNAEEMEPRISNFLKDPNTVFIKIQIPRIEAYTLPAIDENLKKQVVLEAAKRSMASFIKYRYFEPAPYGEIKYKDSEELIDNVRKNKKILLGRFRESDPFLLVYYEGDNNIYQLDFPSIAVLEDNNLCMEVYSASHYMGPGPYAEGSEKPEQIRHDLLEKLKANSIELTLPYQLP